MRLLLALLLLAQSTGLMRIYPPDVGRPDHPGMTPAPPPCEAPDVDPAVSVVIPQTTTYTGLSLEVRVSASDTSGIDRVEITDEVCPESSGYICQGENAEGTLSLYSGTIYSGEWRGTWTFMGCAESWYDNRAFKFRAYAYDTCGNSDVDLVADIVLSGRGC